MSAIQQAVLMFKAAAGGGGGILNIVGTVEFAETYGDAIVQTIGAVGSGNSLIIVTRNDKPDVTVDGATLIDTATMGAGQIIHFFLIENVVDARTSVTIRTWTDGTHTTPSGTNMLRWVFEVDAAAVDVASDLEVASSTGTAIAVGITTTDADALGLLFTSLSIDRTQTGATDWTAVPGTTDYNPYAYNTDLGAAGSKSAAMTLGSGADWMAAAMAFVRG